MGAAGLAALPRTVKRLISTSRGMAQLNVTGTEQQVFVDLTMFDETGRPVIETMWAAHQDERLQAVLARVLGVDEPEAERVAVALLKEWRQSGGSALDTRLTRQFVVGAVGSLLAAATLAAGMTAIVLKLWRRRGK